MINRCGFHRVTETEQDAGGYAELKKRGIREYLVLPHAFRNEVCAGFDFKFAVGVLKEHGCLLSGDDRAQSVRLPGMGKTRVYVINASVWEDKEPDATPEKPTTDAAGTPGTPV